jgi:hypothetical protein
MPTESIKFKGGAWIGFTSATCPFGILIIDKDSIVLKIDGLNELIFTKDNLERIEIKRFLFGLKFIPRPYRIAYFWYWPFKLKKVTNSLKQFGWLN